MIYDARVLIDICLRLSPEARFCIGYYDDKMVIRFFDKPQMGSRGTTHILIDENGARDIGDFEFQRLTLSSKSIKEFPK